MAEESITFFNTHAYSIHYYLVTPLIDDGITDDVGDDPNLTQPHGHPQPHVVDLDEPGRLIFDQGVGEIVKSPIQFVTTAGAVTTAGTRVKHRTFERPTLRIPTLCGQSKDNICCCLWYQFYKKYSVSQDHPQPGVVTCVEPLTRSTCLRRCPVESLYARGTTVKHRTLIRLRVLILMLCGQHSEIICCTLHN